MSEVPAIHHLDRSDIGHGKDAAASERGFGPGNAIQPAHATPAKKQSIPVANAESLEHLADDEFDAGRPAPFSVSDVVTNDVTEWAAHRGLAGLVTTPTGATFIKLEKDVALVPVFGAVPIHHDRHLAFLGPEERLSEHTWNLVVEPSEDQILLVETDHQIFEHFELACGHLIYFNTMNRHLISTKSAHATAVLAQVTGYGPDEQAEAMKRLTDVLIHHASQFSMQPRGGLPC